MRWNKTPPRRTGNVPARSYLQSLPDELCLRSRNALSHPYRLAYWRLTYLRKYRTGLHRRARRNRKSEDIPERYPYWYQSFNKYEELRDKGILLQINLASITGHYGTVAKRISERLIEQNMVSFLGTDTHKMSHVDVFRKARKEPALKKLIESGSLLNTQL